MENGLISKLQFKGCWRSYQKRVLDELQYHLNDNKLNVVASPGAGKTTLGIEVLLRLKNNALILAPSIAIKNQWKQRIIDNFLTDITYSNLISTDIKNLSDITITTYQALYSQYKDKENKTDFINKLKEKKINTLILDEAHHLRAEWWAVLNNLSEELENENFKTVSLTATPPYDVPKSEWNNYNSLCGPVDAEISVAELVLAGDLCPHQDLVYFSDLEKEEEKIIFDFNKKREDFFRYINKNPDILYSVESSDFINNLDNDTEIIYKNIDFSISLISYLLYEDELNIKARLLAEFLGIEISQIPKFDYTQAEILLNGILKEFNQYFKNLPTIKAKLKECGLINGKTVDFTGKTDFKKLFSRSKNKLDAIYKITEFEYKNLNDTLRETILLDYIGKGDSLGLNVLSVFEKLKTLNIPLSVLTGTLIVIPKSAKEGLYNILKSKNIDENKVLTSEFKNNYLRIETYGNVDIVAVISELFNRGEVKILIGTASLLGEGWDSPCLNTLIIASVIGSFMQSNQMRGRALRTDKNNSNKTSDIWHLVSLSKNDISFDLSTVEKRFNTFEGIDYKENKIQNGFERLSSLLCEINAENCDKLNAEIFKYAKQRNLLSEKWNYIFEQTSYKNKTIKQRIYDVVLGENTQNSIIQSKIPKWCLGFDFLINKCSISRKKNKINPLERLFLGICSRLNFISQDYKNIINKNFEIYKKENFIKACANSLLYAMCDLNLIKTNPKKISLIYNEQLNSKFYITLSGCNDYERNLFINSFREIFEIDDKKRYILKYQEKYFAVAELIAKSNKNVKLFAKYLEEYLGYFDIIYTRTPNGYKELLKAKFETSDYGYLKQKRIWI
ncbi:MAG: DEAD/DEAH box helicase family protein [Candidatus Gastranaerophilales bacterium]|nr:DEAD/DEAH box helicase family protein [Candidatus Gastranaerophilales bacterium]